MESVGARLKKIRQGMGINLEDLAKKTKIHLNILRVIEGDSISDLSPIYLKGFIKMYCVALNLDPKEYTGSSTSQPGKPVLNATVGRPIGERTEKKPSLIKDTSVKLVSLKPSADFKKRIVFIILLIIFMFLGINLLKFIFSRRNTSLERAKIIMPVSVPKIAEKQSKAKQPSYRKDLASGFTLGIFARNKSWVTAKVDGKVIFHGVLARGRSEAWQAHEKVELSLGDAGAVELQVNDQRFNNLGRRGKPLKNIIINKEGLKISR
ncbi:MAG: helix-turn-helix domain-containing protein [Candidatus Omnitrophota bacterium]